MPRPPRRPWRYHLPPAPPAVALGLGALIVAIALASGVDGPTLPPALLAVVLLASRGFGLSAGLAAAALGFLSLLWRAAAAAPEGWFLAFAPALDAVMWFAVAKLAAVLAAPPHMMLAREAVRREQAEAASRQQGLLLDELSHRVMNDLQRLVGMLRAEAAAEPQATEPLLRAAGRLQVMGRLHRRIAQRSSDTMTDSAGFIEALVEDLREAVAPGQPVALVAAVERHPLPVATAGDLGLVLNEMVTNALKHAFPDGRAGEVQVAFRRDGGLYELTVADDGIGTMAAGRAGEHPGGPHGPGGGLDGTSEGSRASGAPRPRSAGIGRGGFGGRLVRALAAQLGGRLEMGPGEAGGTVCRLRFPVPPRPAANPGRGEPIPR